MASSDITKANLEHTTQGEASGPGRLMPNFDDLHLFLQIPFNVDLEKGEDDEELARKSNLENDEFTYGSRLPDLAPQRYTGRFRDIIGPSLAKRMATNKNLRHSIITALRKIEFATGEGDEVKAVSETDPENPSWIQNLIKVQLDSQDLGEWKQKKKRVERIAIDSRAGKVELHTLVERKPTETDVN